ncbi:MAG: hypothetical protein GX201_04165 [Clostridiales bacterium]|nr:hypothetical protein [Clostridiales bacterium]
MLIKAKYEAYCRKCGRPIFVNDVFDYDPNSSFKSKALCLVCYTGYIKEDRCHHWAVAKRNYYFSSTRKYPSPRYKDRWSDKDFTCLICSKKITNLGRTQYIKFENKSEHGGSYPKYYVGSRIDHEPIDSKENPDYNIMITIQKMLKMDKHRQYWDILSDHLESLLIRNPCFKEKLSVATQSFEEKYETMDENIYLKTRCKIYDYDALQSYMPSLKRIIEEGVKYVLEDKYWDVRDKGDVAGSVYDYVGELLKEEDVDYYNLMYRKVVMPAYVGSGIEGLDLYGIAYEIYDGDTLEATRSFVCDLVVESIWEKVHQ